MRWLVVSLAIVVLTACSTGGSGSGDEPPDRSADDLATVRARAGLGPATPTPRQTRATPTRQGPTATTEAVQENPNFATDETLFSTLLEPGEIAVTWTLGRGIGLGVTNLCGGMPIEEQFAPLGQAYGYYSAVGGAWVEQWVVRLPESDAIAAMEHARTSLTCEEYTQPRWTGNDIYWGLAPLEIPAVGDESFAKRLDITFQNPVPTPMGGGLAFVRQGEYVVFLLYYGFHPEPEMTAHLAQVAAQRMALATDSSV